MTTLTDVQEAERKADAAEENLSTSAADHASQTYIALGQTAIDLRLEANTLRTQYHTAAGNLFDLDVEEAFYISSTYGDLQPRQRVSKTNLSSVALAEAHFNTQEGDRYYWSSGNTYTFGGGHDYAFCNSYSVTMSAKTTEDNSNFKSWDGSFPYDIYSPKKDEKPALRMSSYETDFADLPDAYKIDTPIPDFFIREPNDQVNFEDNGVGKNIGHTYGYQLGDTYGIQLSKNTHSVTAVDRAHSFESVGISENHSHVGIDANFAAHGLDVELGVKAMGFDFGLTGMAFDIGYTGASFNYSYKLVDITYEKSVNSYQILDRPEFRLSDKNIRLLTTTKAETIAGETIVLQVEDPKSTLMLKPATILGQDSESLGDLVFFQRLWKSIFGSAKLIEKAFEDVLKDTNFNSVRDADHLEGRSSNYSRLDVDLNSVGVASYDSRPGGTFAELVVNSGRSVIELNIRDASSKLRQNVKNTTQLFDITKGIYYVTHFENMDAAFIGKMWVAKSATLGDDAGKGIQKNSGGIYVQKIKDQYATLNLDVEDDVIDLRMQTGPTKFAELKLASKENIIDLRTQAGSDQFAELTLDSKENIIELSAQKAAKTGVLQQLDGAKGTYKVLINGNSSSFELAQKKAALKVKDVDLKFASGKAELTAAKGIELDSAKTIKLAASTKVDVNGSTFTKSSVKIPSGSVSIGSAASNVKISSSGLTVTGAKVGFTAKAMLQLSGGIIKLG
mgnify:FL=1